MSDKSMRKKQEFESAAQRFADLFIDLINDREHSERIQEKQTKQLIDDTTNKSNGKK